MDTVAPALVASFFAVDPTTTTRFVDVEGPANPEETLIRYDVPFAPQDPKRSLRLRKTLGVAPETRSVEPNVRRIIDRFIPPRRWVEPATGLTWVQHASPLPTSRIDTLKTHARLRELLEQYHVRTNGASTARALLVAECFMEVIRAVVAECWERGLLLLVVYEELVAAQVAHRELFESRVGHAFRVALKGERDTAAVERKIAEHHARVAALQEEEAHLRQLCSDFAASSEEQRLVEEKQHADEVAALRKEGFVKKHQLEQMVAVPPEAP